MDRLDYLYIVSSGHDYICISRYKGNDRKEKKKE